MKTTIEQKKTNLFIILAGIFITNAILAEMIGVKIFSLEKTLGLEAAQINLFTDFKLDFNLTAGALIWPIVFISTDIINEYFGKKGVRKVTFLAIGLIAYSFFILYMSTNIAPSDYWLKVNNIDANGQPFNIDYAFQRIFSQGQAIIVASLTAFLIGQLLDVYVFHAIRSSTGEKWLWLRATGSTLVSQLIDSFVVLFIAFYLLAGNNKWSIEQLLSIGIINYIYKFTTALLLTPLLYVAHHFIDNYLGEKISSEIIEDANTTGYQD
ncbi:MAG: queuosine precursor transporter [Cytophaga sp.]|uniref:queuosine precursor transporter n=1 Tax=Cytophaga sp. TaxID=29535 RepID=UPI003F7F5D26